MTKYRESLSLEAAGAESMTLEAAKAEAEMAADYSGCDGFDENFLGFRAPLPSLEKQLELQAAKLLKDKSSYTLDYYHFSTIQHSIRRMPIISAINIDGDPHKRKDNNKRKDQWLRDNRIDFDAQLDDAFYKLSDFDKGHMCRREDANWGRTQAEAFRDAQMTCMYTNACPQVPPLNRAIYGYRGLWGQLEQIILEKGVEKESGNEGKISVYNGPVFVSTDPVFKGIQTPLRFFKVIVWTNAKGEPKATAFILSQEDLVGGIKFEELQLNKKFIEHQCSIGYLENITGLTFDVIRDWDTFRSEKTARGKKVKQIKKKTLEQMIIENSTT